MFDVAAKSGSETAALGGPVMQRVAGAARVALGPSGLRDLYQQGSAKAMLPQVHGAAPEVVFLNTAGGLTGGDRLTYDLTVAAGAQAVGTTQTAERAYAARNGQAQVDVTLNAGAGARLHWLPQETILFNNSALARNTRVDLTLDAEFLMIETIVLGRAAMGEVIERLTLRDCRTVHRAGTPVLIEPLQITDATLARRDHSAVLGGARAFATVALLAQGAEDALPAARAALASHIADHQIEGAATAWDGKLVVRAMAKDAFPLRRAMAHLLTQLRRGPLPRVWQC